jgi:hypothetical protein
MQGQNSVFEGPATSLELRYTSKPVSGWGGLLAVMRYFERRGVRRVLQGALPDGRTSPNQIPVVDMVMAFLAAVLTGSRRFAHVERLRTDKVVQVILGLARIPSAMTLAPALRRTAPTHYRARHFNCDVVGRLRKKSCTQALETAAPRPATAPHFGAQLRVSG